MIGSRRLRQVRFMVLLFLVSSLAGGPPVTTQELSREQHVAWLRDNAIQVRSIDPQDDDFSDLEPLRAALGDVRLVMLGEADHQTGSDFLAKTRLVKFLHEELDFDVLAFEAPIYDMQVAWESLRGGAPPQEAMWLGAGTWAGAAQMQPLVSYLGDQAHSQRPLEVAGFDHQHQMASGFSFVSDLAGFLSERGVGGPLIQRESQEHSVLEALAGAHYQYGLVPRPDLPTRQSFLAAVEESLARVSRMPDEEAGRWEQVLRSLACHTRFVMRDPELGTCHRDEQMAENLLWLANERYPGRKIIAWVATMHAIRAPEAPSFLPSHPLVASTFPAMGESIGEAMGSASFVIGVTSHRDPGAGMFPDQNLPLPQFEKLMVASGFDYGLLDLRRARAEGTWPGGEFLARPLIQVSGAAVWSDLLDALFFVREFVPRQNLEPPNTALDAISQVRESEINAFLSGDLESYVALFTEGCVVIPPGEARMEGYAALRSWFQRFHDQYELTGGELTPLATVPVGGFAWELYDTTITLKPKAGGEGEQVNLRVSLRYREQPDGSWRIAEKVWNVRGGGNPNPKLPLN